MRSPRKEQGVVMIASIMTVMFIAMLSTAMLMQSLATSRHQQNSVRGEKAVQLAEGGIDAALLELSWDGDGIDNDFDGTVDEAEESDGIANAGLGGGNYTTTIVDFGDGSYDITSTGLFQGIDRTVQVSAAIFAFPDTPGAVTLVNETGVDGAGINFDGNAMTVDGNDTNPNGTAGAGTAMPGIAVFDDLSVSDIQAALRFPDNVAGDGGDPSVVNVSATSTMTLNALLQAADRFRSIADAYYPQETNRINNAEFGTPGNPQVTVIGDQLTIGGGSSGSGVLVIDGDLEIRGNFDFEGLIIVTGRGNMTFGNLSAAGNTNIHGAVLVGVPSGTSLTGDLDIRGNIDIWYSEQTLNAARAMLGADLKKPAIVSWRRVLPNE